MINPAVISTADAAHIPSGLLPSGLPKAWYSYIIDIELSMRLEENTCVYRELYEAYEVRSMKDAMKKLVALRARFDCLPSYRIYSLGDFNPPLVYVTSPLSRLMKDALVVERGMITGTYPWSKGLDDTLFCLFADRKWPGDESRLRLRVGGSSPDDASEKWLLVARVLRLLKAEVRSEMKSLQRL
jgi:hypothetical protein